MPDTSTALRAQRGLVGDLGGTTTRFAQAEIGKDGGVQVLDIVEFEASHYETADAALRAYIERDHPQSLSFAAIACAGPVHDGQATMTNLNWTLTERDLKETLSLEQVHLLNDLAAAAWAAPQMAPQDMEPIGPAMSPGGIIAVLGAGTGSNCARFAPEGTGGSVMVGEGGHISFAPTDEAEVAIWRFLSRQFARVSIERLASGPGVINIYQALCDIKGQQARGESAEALADLAAAGDAIALEAQDRFCSILGAVAGDFVLSFGADAVHVIGGVAPRILTTPERANSFRERFEDKGRFRGRLQSVGSWMVTNPHVGLIGAARAAMAKTAGLHNDCGLGKGGGA